jgi:excisionase family DNA binding protein
MTRPKIPQDASDPFLTTQGVASLLGVCLRSVQNWVNSGTLVAGRTPGGHRRIRTSAAAALGDRLNMQAPIRPDAPKSLKALASLLEASRVILTYPESPQARAELRMEIAKASALLDKDIA